MSFDKAMHSLIAKIFFTISAVFAPFVWMLSWDAHYFFDFFTGFTLVILALSVASSLYVLAYLYFSFSSKPLKHKAFGIAYYVCSLLSVIILIAGVIIACTQSPQMSRSIFIKELPFLAVITLAVTLLFATNARKKRLVAIVALTTLCLTAALGIAVPLAGGGSINFEATPAVFDIGDTYVVAWATSTDSTGAIEYEYGGQTHIIYDQTAGKLDVGHTHAIVVPKDHLNSNKYTVTSKKVLRNVAYGSQIGKSVTFTANFSVVTGKEFTVNVLTDNHNISKSFYNKISKNTRHDTLIMLGDFADLISDEQTIIDHLLYPSGLLTGGERPVIYAKGNHENRGAETIKLANLLGIDKFYYNLTLGDYRVTVLDSSEDKLDSSVEYGLADFERYRKEQLDYFDNLPLEEKTADIIIVHNRYFAPDKETHDRFVDFMSASNAKLCLCGHSHVFSFDSDLHETGIPYLICGGKQKPDYVYSILTFKQDTIRAEAFSVKTGKTGEYTIALE